MDGLELHISSDPKFAKIVRCCIGHLCEICGFPESAGRAVTLAVDEAFTNIIKYAYQGESGKPITVRCNIRADRLEIVLQDRGIKADPAKLKSRELSDVRPGGLGIHFIKSTMDIVTYQSSQTTGNQLTLAKYLPESGKNDADN